MDFPLNRVKFIFLQKTNFTFSAKERDTETGLSYFGSRYYSSDLSIWLSVDPQAAKYPGLSPFTYCADNPVKLVDPNGEEVVKNTYKWEFNQTTGKISYVGEDGGKFHQTVVMTKNTSDTRYNEYTVDYNGSITDMFDFSVFSPTIDDLISGGLDVKNGVQAFAAGVAFGCITEGVGTAMAAGICFAGAGQMGDGIKTIAESIDGQPSKPYIHQEIIKDVCKFSLNVAAAYVEDMVNNPKIAIKNSAKNITKSLAWIVPKYYKMRYPTKKQELPKGAIIND